jgi:hypothetical protein
MSDILEGFWRQHFTQCASLTKRVQQTASLGVRDCDGNSLSHIGGELSISEKVDHIEFENSWTWRGRQRIDSDVKQSIVLGMNELGRSSVQEIAIVDHRLPSLLPISQTILSTHSLHFLNLCIILTQHRNISK